LLVSFIRRGDFPSCRRDTKGRREPDGIGESHLIGAQFSDLIERGVGGVDGVADGNFDGFGVSSNCGSVNSEWKLRGPGLEIF